MTTLSIALRALAGSALILSLVLLSFGCGGGDAASIHLEGTVTYDGQPVPRGQIFFSPDTAKGNSGPGSMAVIRDGKYSTREGLGVVGGPHIVRIEGFDGVAVGDNADGSLLFPPYKTEEDLPDSSGTLNFNVED